MTEHAKQSLLISPFLVFYLIHSMQIGVGILGFARYIADAAGFRAWIAVILTGLIYHLIIWMMYCILNGRQSQIIEINRFLFGTLFGHVLSFLFMIYLLFLSITVLRTYIEVVQTWVFPDLPTWALSLSLLVVVYYAVTHGFRVVAGVCFLGVVVPLFLFLTAFSTFEFATYRNLLPLFDTSLKVQLDAAMTMTLSYLGPEILLVFYPFIKDGQKSQKFAHFAILFTTFIYLLIAILTFIFYSENQLKTTVFPTLSAWKVVELPFIERFEYLGIATWMFVILPNITLGIWAASRMLKQQLNIAHRLTLPVVTIVAFAISLLFETRVRIDGLNNAVALAGRYVTYLYIPVLFILMKWRTRKKT
ncbi:GerAB/ArcD/ProY family transporter [Halalkalibacter oceani]|uniref:Spore germination protein n=1 Tax=Halalkalibacter oceani TaxID=1653776 RepID=A0A9X2DPC7_9BACI|nr:GerAB/ArcD/ProY family transporter [Halalkalibacter oceani]MCM3712947.1 spore germination protein [Halalkalibacter oceani]